MICDFNKQNINKKINESIENMYKSMFVDKYYDNLIFDMFSNDDVIKIMINNELTIYTNKFIIEMYILNDNIHFILIDFVNENVYSFVNFHYFDFEIKFKYAEHLHINKIVENEIVEC